MIVLADSIQKHKKWIVPALYFIAGFAVAVPLSVFIIVSENKPCKITTPNTYKFTDLDIPCEVQDTITHRYDVKLKGKVQDYVERSSTKKISRLIAVYYYNFKDKSWFGINENENFYPSSLLKLPVLIAMLKETETDPDFLSKVITFKNKTVAIDQYFQPKETLVPGKTYTMAQLADIMMTYSSNEAAFVLWEVLGEDKITTVYKDIGVPLPTSVDDKFISVHQYMSFFKVLYNSHYLSRTASEYALNLLSKSAFEDGLAAGTPSGIVVSHKFGERTDPKSDIKQLHDCGIIYAPGNPYLLCVMTQGNDFKPLSNVIKTISQTVYENVSKKSD